LSDIHIIISAPRGGSWPSILDVGFAKAAKIPKILEVCHKSC